MSALGPKRKWADKSRARRRKLHLTGTKTRIGQIRHPRADLEQQLNGYRREIDLAAQLDLLLIIAQSREFDGALDVDALHGTLERIQRHHSTWRALRVTNPEGQVLIDVPSVIAQGRLLDETSHRQTIEQRQPVV